MSNINNEAIEKLNYGSPDLKQNKNILVQNSHRELKTKIYSSTPNDPLMS